MAKTSGRILKGRALHARGARIPNARFEQVCAARRDRSAAQVEAERIREVARTEAVEIRRQAAQEGRLEGRRSLAAAEMSLRAEAARIRAEAAERLVRLAATLARQVLDRELQTGPAAIRALVRKALSQVSWCRQAVLHLHPEDAAVLTRDQPGLAQLVSEGADLTLQADPTLERGDCVLQTDAGRVDGSVRTQLAALERALLHPLEDPTDER